jgi:ferrochelatase
MSAPADLPYDALLLVSFGGPEGPDDVMPFLRRVVHGRGVPDERLAQVAEHYLHFGGVSPINGQCRALLAALRPVLDEAGITLPLYWGNRNWTPLLPETVAQMRADGVRHALAFITSPYGSWSSCRQYLDDIEAARAAVGDGAPVIDKIRHYHDHPGYIEPHADSLRAGLAELSGVDNVRIVFTAHSVPSTMEATSGPHGGRYSAMLNETAGLVAAAAAPGADWDLVWQSRSGSPHVPWLSPDINDHLRILSADGVGGVVVSPIGFISDHLEVVWDLDTEAAQTAKQLGLAYVRAATPGTDPRFVALVRDVIRERLDPGTPRQRLGTVPVWEACPAGCCRLPTHGG